MRNQIGFIGTGEIARIHADSILNLPLCWDIHGGYDLNRSACEAFHKNYGGKSYENPEDLISDPDIDTVYICTRHDSHARYGKMACEYGKNVFLEKPVAMDSGQAVQLLQVWNENPVPFAVGYNMRVAPSIIKLKEKLKQYKVIPEAFRVNMTGVPFMQGWAGDPKTGGGVLVCQGSHMFDLIMVVMGSLIREVCAEVLWLGQPCGLEPNGAVVLIKLENGVCGTLLMHDRGNESYHVAPGGGMVNITVYSEQGTFDADAYGRLRYGTEAGLCSMIPTGTDKVTERWGYQKETECFVRLTEGQGGPLCTLKQAVNTARVVDAARRSAAERKWVAVDD